MLIESYCPGDEPCGGLADRFVTLLRHRPSATFPTLTKPIFKQSSRPHYNVPLWDPHRPSDFGALGESDAV